MDHLQDWLTNLVMYSLTAHKGLCLLGQIPFQPRYLTISQYRLRGLTVKWRQSGGGKPRDMTLPSTHHSPKTVNRNAKEFTMGTMRLSSATCIHISNCINPGSLRSLALRLFSKFPSFHVLSSLPLSLSIRRIRDSLLTGLSNQ